MANATVVSCTALGEDAVCDILFAGSGTGALPMDMAQALLASGAQQAMEFDINPGWVQLAFGATPAGHLQAGVPGQVRPAGQYTVGWTRDFITVLVGPGG